MSMQLYRKIIQDISDMVRIKGQRITRLHLYKDGEPLLNRYFSLMIALAKKAEISQSVETTTNGALLTSDVVNDILNSGLDVIRVSIAHTEESVYASFSKGSTTYKQIRENVNLLFTKKTEIGNPLHVHVKIIDCNLSSEQKEKFKQDFSSISDSWNIDGVMGWASSNLHDLTLGSTKSVGIDGVTPKQQRNVCPEPFTKLAINHDGSVSVCCVDWTHSTVVGDITHQTVHDVWIGERLKQFRLQHLNGNRLMLPACSSCDYISGFPDFTNLDEHTFELLPLFENAT